MSLIHDALKKAQEKDKAPMGSGLSGFHDTLDEGKPKISKTTIILGVVFTLVIVFLAYSKFSGKGGGTGSGDVPAVSPIAVQTQPDAQRLKKSAADSFNTDDLETAWASITSANQLDANDPEVWNNMGLIARKRGDATKAREAYEKALALRPEYPEAMNNLAILEMQAGNVARAKELLDKATKLVPSYAEANFNLALLYDQAGDRVKAVEYYKRFVDTGKNFPSSVIDSVRDRVMEIEPR